MRCAQMRQGFASNKKWPARIGFKNRIPLLKGQGIERRRVEDRRVVHENVETAEGLDHAAKRRLHRGFGTYVALECTGAEAERSEFRSGAGGFNPRFSISDSYVGSGPCQRQRDLTANAARASGDKCGFALQR